MQKGTATLFVLIILLVVGIAAFFVFKTSKSSVSPTAQPLLKAASRQSVYQNQALGLEFQYPKDLSTKEDTETEFNKRGTGADSKNVNGDFRKNFKGYVGYEPGTVLGAVVVLGKEQNFETNPISIWVFDNPQGLTKEAWFNKYWYYPFVWGVFDYTSKGHIALDGEATISGKQAKYKIVSYQPGKPKFVYMTGEKKIYLLRVIGEEGEKILSTFKLSQ